MVIEVKRESEFIPEWNGNRDLDEKEQITIVHRFLKPGERQKYIYVEPIEFDYSGEKTVPKSRYVQNSAGVAKAVITGIKNLSINQDGKEIVVDTVGKLYDTEGVPQALVSEIEAYLLNASPEVDRDFLS